MEINVLLLNKLPRTLVWMFHRIMMPGWRKLLCRTGHHVDLTLPGESGNFCAACGTELHGSIYYCFSVKSKDGAFDRLVYAVNLRHALALVAHLYHEENLLVVHKGIEKGMTRDEWRESMADIISTMPETTRRGWM